MFLVDTLYLHHTYFFCFYFWLPLPNNTNIFVKCTFLLISNIMFFMLYIMGDISGGRGAWGVPPQTECILNEIFRLKAFINKVM